MARAAAVAALGLRDAAPSPDEATVVEAALADPDPRVRAVAVAALVRAGPARRVPPGWRAATVDPAAPVRRRAAELAPLLTTRSRARPERRLVTMLHDADVGVVEAAAWALGELGRRAVAAGAVDALAVVAREHRDPLAREAAVGALGALADPLGLPAVLAACRDAPAVRRRAVLALAPFRGAEVEAALRAALQDRDRQVRQAAEDLLAEDLLDEDPLDEDPLDEDPLDEDLLDEGARAEGAARDGPG